jgi:hypothetical protein
VLSCVKFAIYRNSPVLRIIECKLVELILGSGPPLYCGAGWGLALLFPEKGKD